jgi:hypothetical protein
MDRKYSFWELEFTMLILPSLIRLNIDIIFKQKQYLKVKFLIHILISPWLRHM